MRALRVLVPVAVVALAAVVGTVLNYLYLTHGRSHQTFDLLVGLRMQPFSGRLVGRGTSGQDLLAWFIGLVVLLAVLAAFVALLGRTGRVTAFLAGWLGTIVGTAAAALVAGLAYLSRLYPSGSVSGSAPVRTQFLSSTFGNGLYWGLFVGFVVGLVAMLVGGRLDVAVPAGPAEPTPGSGIREAPRP